MMKEQYFRALAAITKFALAHFKDTHK